MKQSTMKMSQSGSSLKLITGQLFRHSQHVVTGQTLANFMCLSLLTISFNIPINAVERLLYFYIQLISWSVVTVSCYFPIVEDEENDHENIFVNSKRHNQDLEFVLNTEINIDGISYLFANQFSINTSYSI